MGTNLGEIGIKMQFTHKEIHFKKCHLQSGGRFTSGSMRYLLGVDDPRLSGLPGIHFSICSHPWMLTDGGIMYNRIDRFTVSLYFPNGRHLPAIRAVQGDCQWLLKTVEIPTGQMSPRSIGNGAILTCIYCSQSKKDDASQMEAMSHSQWQP